MGSCSDGDQAASLTAAVRELELQQTSKRVGAEPVNAPMIRMFCEAIEDGSPLYWDDEWASSSSIGTVASPPTLTLSWCTGRAWTPRYSSEASVSAGGLGLPEETIVAPLKAAGYDHGIDLGVETDWYRPYRVGDVLTWEIGLAGEAELLPHFSLGPGVGLWVGGPIYNQRGERLAFERFHQVVYRSAERGVCGRPESRKSRRYEPTVTFTSSAVHRTVRSLATIRVSDVAMNDDLPSYALEWHWMRMMWAATSTRDWYPDHHDPVHAERAGARGIFLDQMAIAGMYGRLVTDWAGPEARLRRLALKMLRPVCLSDTTAVGGRVIAKRSARNSETDELENLVELHLEMFNSFERGLCGRAHATVALPD